MPFATLLGSTKKSKKLVPKSPLIICILDPLICVPCIYTASPSQRTNVDLAKCILSNSFDRLHIKKILLMTYTCNTAYGLTSIKHRTLSKC